MSDKLLAGVEFREGVRSKESKIHEAVAMPCDMAASDGRRAKFDGAMREVSSGREVRFPSEHVHGHIELGVDRHTAGSLPSESVGGVTAPDIRRSAAEQEYVAVRQLACLKGARDWRAGAKVQRSGAFVRADRRSVI
jgi:hypothetical protein